MMTKDTKEEHIRLKIQQTVSGSLPPLFNELYCYFADDSQMDELFELFQLLYDNGQPQSVINFLYDENRILTKPIMLHLTKW